MSRWWRECDTPGPHYHGSHTCQTLIGAAGDNYLFGPVEGLLIPGSRDQATERIVAVKFDPVLGGLTYPEARLVLAAALGEQENR